MPITITYFVHGTTTDNEQGLSTGWNQGELSELGRKQAEELGKTVAGETYDAIFASDLKRAVDSAELGFGNKYKIITDERLRECNYGKLNGGLSNIVEPMHGQCITDRFLEGESYEEVKERMASFLKYLEENFNGKHIAIVSHKAPQLALEVLINGKTWQQAFDQDWRKTKSWQPGWKYELK